MLAACRPCASLAQCSGDGFREALRREYGKGVEKVGMKPHLVLEVVRGEDLTTEDGNFVPVRFFSRGISYIKRFHNPRMRRRVAMQDQKFSAAFRPSVETG